MDGVFAREQLLADGFSPWQIRRALAAGRLRRVGGRWYAAPHADPGIVAALASGCRIGCLTAADFHGLWTPPHAERHWVAPRSRRVGHLPEGVTLHRTALPIRDAIQPVEDCVWQIVTGHDPETALIVLESAARRELIPRSALLNMIERAPVRSRSTLAHFSDRSDSGTETRVRLFYQRRGVRVRAQVQVPGVGRVDLLVGESHIVECDSRAHHSAGDRYLNDRARDLGALVGGFRHTRLSWEQVFLDWATTRSRLSLHLRRRTHRNRPDVDVWLPPVRSSAWLAS